jgi:hypothetical protein
MKAYLRFIVATACMSLIGPAVSQDREVEPTQAEVDYMNRLDTHMGENYGGNDTVDAKVTESDSGDRKIHMDYSDSEGAVITADPQ